MFSGRQIILFFFLMLFYSLSSAQLSPGKLHKVHKDLEGIKNCTKCHAKGKNLSGVLCLDCHKLLKSRIEQGKGLHANEEFRKCEKCHIEHQGRNAELIYWDKGKRNFDHSKTGYDLNGAHSRLTCEDCHNEKNISREEVLIDQGKDLNRTFLGLDEMCLSCHLDEHRGQMQKTCLDCHNMKAWTPVLGFDHNETKFKLTGLHQQVKCLKCHKVKTDQPLEKDKSYIDFDVKRFMKCIDCHEDPHQGRLGEECKKCHTTAGWEKYNKKEFNHDLTAFSLKGKHQSLECKKCHVNSDTWKISRFKNCSDCHQDYHQGQFITSKSKGACESCHTVDGFTPSVFTLKDHQATKYPLKGAHRAVPCILCHRKINSGTPLETHQFQFKSVRCLECHQDPHENQLDKYLNLVSSINKMNQCEHCHITERWDKVTFDHALTNFKLEGKHQKIICRECHKPDENGVFKFVKVTNKCEGCHKDIHYGQFKRASGAIDCDRCHTPHDWLARKFDHNRDARFELTGAHQKVPCSDCHQPVVKHGKQFIRYRPMAFDCRDCHGNNLEKKKL